MTQTEIKKNYIDVTKQYLDKKKKKYKVINSYYYISNGQIYIVDGSKKVVLDYSKKELEIAHWIGKAFGGTIYMKPRVNVPDGVKTADYYWNNEYWDLKEIKNARSNSRAIDNIIKSHKNQSHNFIFDITGSIMPLDIIIMQVTQLYNSKKF